MLRTNVTCRPERTKNRNEMKKLLLILICTTSGLTLFAQPDTIVTKKGKKIICEITNHNAAEIYYRIEDIPFNKVEYIVEKGKKKFADNIANENVISLADTKTAHDSIMISRELEYMKNCFRSSHREYVAGATTSLCGILIGIVGLKFATDPKSSDSGVAVSAVAGAITLTGGIIMFDSHKWIGRAGMGITGNGIGVKYIFK